MNKKGVNLSVCVPALNEEKSLRTAVQDLLSTLSPSFSGLEIIIVNDASTDLTSRLADQLAKDYPYVKVIHHSRQKGLGACYRDAARIASGDYLTWFPGDHENSAEEFIQCLEYLKEDTIVTCHHRGRDPRSLPRRCISRIFTWLINRLFCLNMKYYNGLAIFPMSVIRSLPLVSNGFLFTAENLVRALKHGYKVVELSAPLKRRERGESNALTFRSLKSIMQDVLHILLDKRKKDIL